MAHLEMKFSLLVFLGAIQGATTLYALDLTPILAFRDLEGVKLPIVQFNDGNSIVSWDPPWPISTGSAKKLALVPQSLHTTVTLELVSLGPGDEKPPESSAEADAIVKWVPKFLPGDISDLNLIEAVASPYRLNGNSSHEFTVFYSVNDRKLGASISYVNVKDTERLMLVIIGPLDTFPATRNTVIASMFSIDWETAQTVKSPSGSLPPSP